jgi:hypothetical protein
MGRAYDAWGRIKTAWVDGDSDLLWDQYAPNGVYLEALNPPHEGRDLIRSYVEDFTSARPNITIEETRVIDGGDAIAVEWLFSYDQPSRGSPTCAAARS